MKTTFQFNEEQFNRMFPFYFLLDNQLRVISTGKSLFKLLSIQNGSLFTELFNIQRPQATIRNIGDLEKLKDELVVLAAKKEGCLLRGQLEFLEEDQKVLFVGTPWFDSMESVKERHMVINDFAYHDPLIDLLHVLKAQEITNLDLKELVETINVQKNELKRVNKEIHDIALFPMQNPDPLFRIDMKGSILKLNPAAELLTSFEYASKIFSRQDFFQFIINEIDTTHQRWIFEATALNESYSFVCKSLPDEGYINIYGRNTTNEKRNEKKLNRLALVASANENGVLFTDPHGKITWANEGFCKLTGYLPEEIIGKTPIELCKGPLTDIESIYKVMEAFYGQQAFNTEIIYYRKDGTWFWGRSTSQPLKNELGELIEFFGIIEDITVEKEANQRFRLALEIIGDNVWELDLQSNKTFFSEAGNSFLGYAPEDFAHNENLWLERVHTDDMPMIVSIDRHYRNGEIDSHSIEYRMLHKDGSIKWVLDRGVAIEKNKKGFPTKITGTHTDITSRKEAEKTFEAQRKFYEEILNNIPADIAVFNEKHEYLFVNPRGIKDDELRKWIIGKRDEDYCVLRNKPLEIASARRKTFDDVVSTRQTKEWEEKIISPEGIEIVILRRMYPVLDKQGTVSLVIGYGIDITERKKIEQAIQANEEKYRGIIANMNLGLMETNADRKITYANQSLIGMMKIPADEIIGFDTTRLLEQHSSLPFSEAREHRKRGISQAYELLVTVNDCQRWWLVSSAPKYNAVGNFEGTIVICLDINEQKELEKNLREARELAESSSLAKQSFLANMSHEIRTPMNAILGMSNQLGKTVLNSDQQFYLNTIHSAADNLLIIINDILDLSKIEAGKLSIENIGFEPKKIIERAMLVMMHRAEEKGLTFKNSFFQEKIAPVLIGDPYRLNQILLNLISNAIKFTEVGVVDIRCSVEDENNLFQKLKIEIIDSGIGMEEAFVKNLFQKFTQEDETVTRRFGGTGLGMSICKELVELMGGTIKAHSKKNEGTTISFWIPFEKGTIDQLPVKETDLLNTSIFNNKKILVADDNEMNRLVAQTILESYGATIIEAENGKAAIEKIAEHDVDVVLMDIQMPVMDGVEATKYIRQTMRKSIPVIALTALAIKGDQEKLRNEGLDDYISKPFDEKEFIKIISRWLSKDPAHLELESHRFKEEVLYDLESLNSISRGNKTFVNKMLHLFIEQTPPAVQEMQKAFEANDLDKMGSLAHRIKPAIDNLNISSIKQTIRDIETFGRTAQQSDQLPALLKKTQETISKVTEQLKCEMEI